MSPLISDSDVMARTLVGAMRSDHMLAYVEAGLPQSFAEGLIRALRQKLLCID